MYRLQQFLLIIACLFSVGCGPTVVFKQPMVNPLNAPQCPELLGLYPWESDSENHEMFLYLHAAKGGNPPGFFKITFLTSMADGRMEFTEQSILGFCFKDGNDYFIHLPFAKTPDEVSMPYFHNQWSLDDTIGYEICLLRAKEREEEFEWLLLDSDYLAEQIELGHLRGETDYGEQLAENEIRTPQAVTVTATTEELQRFFGFLKKHKMDKAFNASTVIPKWRPGLKKEQE